MQDVQIIVPVSGGKDSQAVLALAVDLYGAERIRAVHQFTGYDHSATYKHLRYMERRYKVKIEFTKSEVYADIFEFIDRDNHFPHGARRGCTRALKQRPFKAWLKTNAFPSAVVLMGMRTQESSNRAASYGGLTPEDEFMLGDLASVYRVKYLDRVSVKLPIVDWSSDRVFAFLKGRRDKVNPLYAAGFDRVGCFPCLFSKDSDWTLAAKDEEGKGNIQKLLDLQEFMQNRTPGKSLKIHPTRDVAGLLRGASGDPDADYSACGWCSI